MVTPVFGLDATGGVPAAINNLVEDLSPQFGADMDMNGFNLLALTADGPAVLDLSPSNTVPNLLPNQSRPGTGIGGLLDEMVFVSDGQRVMTIGSAPSITFHTAMASAVANGPRILNQAATGTAPTLLPRGISADGIGSSASGQLSVIVGSVEILNFQAGLISATTDHLAKTSDGAILSLQTSLTAVIDGSVLGRIDFTAPDEAGGGDSILLAASIVAESDSVFSATINDTDLVFMTGLTGAASERMRLSSSLLSMFETEGPALENSGSSAMNPTIIPNRSDLGTGVGAVANAVTLIAANTTYFTADDNVGANVFGFALQGTNAAAPAILNEAASATNPTVNPNRASITTGLGGVSGAASLIAGGVERISVNATGIGFFATAPVGRPTGVTVDAAGIHAALVTLGLITA